jgi:ADP-dependent NAD(P)H-hydrate dehydratase / NAD(P)H-hydrate epimerase
MTSKSAHDVALLATDEMAAADRRAAALGVPSATLMERAGAAVAAEIRARYAPRPTVVLCGPGNNGGDGFVVARHLARAGWKVEVALLGDRGALKGDAAAMAALWTGKARPLAPEALTGAELIVDAIFGAGLSRAIDGPAAAVVKAANKAGAPIVAVDIPTGIDGDSGAARGAAINAVSTVTFFRKKPGHLLYPGRAHCGGVAVADIGIPARVLDDIKPRQWENGPGLWGEGFSWPKPGGHKYDRGHAVVRSGGPLKTGAARLAARGALRAGAGLVTIAAAPAAAAVHAARVESIMVAATGNALAWRKLLADPRKNAVLIGPNNGVDGTTREAVLAALKLGKACVLDADALGVFAAKPAALFRAIGKNVCVLTPHEGEFERLFGAGGDKLSRARAAAKLSGAVVVLKGADTVIAAPDGRAAINANAPPELASAGTGDVLAGMVLGLLAQGLAAFEAAAAAVWLHGAAASDIGPGLIAEDISEALPAVLRRLKN